jgi:hypothetical protein
VTTRNPTPDPSGAGDVAADRRKRILDAAESRFA